MSVTHLRNFVEKSGCGIAFAVVIGALMIFSMSSAQCRNGAHDAQGQTAQDTRPPVVAIGEYVVRPSTLEQAASSSSAGGALQEVLGVGGTLVREIDNGIRYDLIKKLGVVLNDEKIVKQQLESLDFSLNFQRQNAMSSGQLKQNATEEEWQNFFKSRVGKTIDEYKQEFTDELRKKLKDKEQRAPLVAQAASGALNEKVAEGITVSDEQLKKSYDTFEIKKISFGSPSNPEDAAMPTAETALKRLNGGGNFDQIKKSYDKSKVPAGQPAPPNEKLQRRTLDQQPYYKEILSLKPGQHTGIIVGPGGVEIIQLVKVTQDLPKDFEKDKESLRKTYKDLLASLEVEKMLKKERESGNIKINGEAYNAVYKFMTTAASNSMDQDWSKGLKNKLLEVLPVAKSAAEKEVENRRLASFLYYVVVDQLWNTAKKDEKLRKEYEQDRVESLQAMLTEWEDIEARIALAEVLTARKDAGAAMQLQKASEMLYGDSELADGQFRVINELLSKIKNLSLANQQEIGNIQKELDRWKEEKKKHDQEVAEQKRLEEEERKKNEVKPVERSETKKAASDEPKPAGPTKTLPNGIKITPMTGAPPAVQKSRDEQKKKTAEKAKKSGN